MGADGMLTFSCSFCFLTAQKEGLILQPLLIRIFYEKYFIACDSLQKSETFSTD